MGHLYHGYVKSMLNNQRVPPFVETSQMCGGSDQILLARFDGIRTLAPHFRVTFYATTGPMPADKS